MSPQSRTMPFDGKTEIMVYVLVFSIMIGTASAFFCAVGLLAGSMVIAEIASTVFAICFVAGAIAVACLKWYGKQNKKPDAHQHPSSSDNDE